MLYFSSFKPMTMAKQLSRFFFYILKERKRQHFPPNISTLQLSLPTAMMFQRIGTGGEILLEAHVCKKTITSCIHFQYQTSTWSYSSLEMKKISFKRGRYEPNFVRVPGTWLMVSWQSLTVYLFLYVKYYLWCY